MASDEDEDVSEVTGNKSERDARYSEVEDELSQMDAAIKPITSKTTGKQTGEGQTRHLRQKSQKDVKIEVRVHFPERPWEYLRLNEEPTVARVVDEVERHGGELWYRIRFEDGMEEEVS